MRYLSSGPIVVMVLEGNDVAANRKIMGATNPKDAEKILLESYLVSL